MPLKSALFLCFYMLCRTRNKQVGSQPAGLYFMMQFQNVIRHADKKPFHCDIGISSGQKSAEVQIFLDCGKHTLRLNGTIDPEQDPFVCGNLLLHCFSLLDKIFGDIQTLDAVFQRFFVRLLLTDALRFYRAVFAVRAFVDSYFLSIAGLGSSLISKR